MKNQREIYNMNPSWKFHDGDITIHNQNTVHDHFIKPEFLKAGNNGLAFKSFDDSKWKEVDLPHDFVIEKNEYDITNPSCTGSFKKGIVWYRKTFSIPETDRGRRLFLQFDGIYRNCEVWLNGGLVGRHLDGYIGFEFEITELIQYGQHNSIAIKVDASEFEGWWYEGGGIYRDVRLVKTQQVKILDQEVYAKTVSINIPNKTAKLQILGAIDCGNITKNEEYVNVEIRNPMGKTVYSKDLKIKTHSYAKYYFETTATIESVILWDITETNLYTIEISINNDSYSTPFGLRQINYSAKAGFELNGKTIKLKGVCGHDDFAGVGTALTTPIIRYKIERLMSMGVNAYRCSHNPPAPKFLKICDELGLLVMDETRLPGISDDNMDDYIRMIKRDRNHPCVICWSMGNEEMAIHRTEIGVQIFKKMTAIGNNHDDTRPFLYAINADYDNIVDFDRKHNMIINPVGLNYFVNHDKDIYNTMHKRYPDLCMINTETTGICSTREFSIPYDDKILPVAKNEKIYIWDDDRYVNKITCYGSNRPIWGVTPETSWKVHADRPYSAGAFLWTGFDYRGEVFPFDYPATISFFGVIDLCGFEKDWYYYMKANWTHENVLHLLPHWNMNIQEGTPVSVWAFTNCEEVELFLNGKSLGKKTCEKYGHIEWETKYYKGKIEAIGYKNGKEVMRDKKVTSGEPARLVLKPNVTTLLANNEDAVIIAAHLEDKDGNIVITSKEVINFEFEGACEFLGTGNGDHFGSEPDKEPKRSLFAGKCIVIAKSTYEAGMMKVIAKWNGLETAIELKTTATNYIPVIKSEIADKVVKKVKADADGGM